MSIRHHALRAASLLLIGACASGPRVETDYDRGTSFANLRSYAILRAQRPNASANALAGDDLMRQRVESAVRAEMARKGWREVAVDGSPDLLVAAHGTTRQQVDVDNFGYAYAPWSRWYTPAMATTSIRTYDEGTLVIDMVDPRAKKMVWRGTASGALGSRKNVTEAIPGAVSKILAGFPPS